MTTILLIDDSESLLALLQGMLTEAGYRVVSANNGESGLEILQKTRVDLVITDICMPDVDGLEVMAKVQQSWPKVPVIAMSSNNRRVDLLRTAKVLGASRILKKPFSEGELNRAVLAALKEARATANSIKTNQAVAYHP